MRIQIPPSKTKAYFKLSLFTLLTLLTQVLIALFFKTLFYNEPPEFWSSIKVIIFDISTLFAWCSLGFFIIKKAKKDVDFKIIEKTKPLCILQWLAIILLITLTAYASYIHWHGIKVIKAYSINGLSVFIFQHIIYVVEAFLISMFLSFLQRALEPIYKRTSIPYVGIFFAIICLSITMLLQAPLATIIYLTFLSFLFGSTYLLCNRNLLNTFLLILLLLVI